jgi:hypothetical protein
VHDVYNAPAVGDYDHDGDADAVDGWKSEHGHQHIGDMNPPRGVPVAWSGGGKGFGHRAISQGNGKIRSTDVNGPGTVGTVDITWFARHWSNLHYLGWSESISGIMIPLPPHVVVHPPVKSNLQIAREVIAGKWGVGATRVALLKKAGYNPTTIQALVNSLVK